MYTEIKIRGYHTDFNKHVNNARFLEFLEEARWQLIDDYIGFEYFTNNNFRIFAVNINISYKSPVMSNDTIIIKSELRKIGNTSTVQRQQIINKETNTVCVDSDITFLIVDAEGKPVKIEGDLRKKIEQLPFLE